MGHRAVELAEPVLALVDLRRGQAEVVTHRCLPDQLDCLRHALPARKEMSTRNVFRNLRRGLGQEIENNLAEHLILLEKLVSVKALAVPQRAELHCFGNNGSPGIQISLWAHQISSNALDQQRHVIEKFV